MAKYVRGQVCGVDNCPSRLWKRVDGRNVCQYGHVNEYDIEIDDEDDMMVTGGGNGGGADFSRRLTNVAGLTTSQTMRNKMDQLSTEKYETRKYGEDFKKLHARCFQIILSKNTKFIMKQLNMNEDQRKKYLATVKLNWIKLLHYLLHPKKDRHGNIFSIGYLSMINYISLIGMNFPIFLSDYIALTFNKKFYLERAEYCLPRNLRIQIPISQLRVFHGHTLFNYMKKFSDSKFILDIFRKDVHRASLNYYPLLVRTVLNLYLPLGIIKMVKNCIDYLKIDFTFEHCIANEHLHPELKLMALIFIMTEIYFMSKDNDEYYNWHYHYTQERENFNFIDLKKRIFFNSSFKDLHSWTESQVDDFVRFYEAHVLPNINCTNIATNNEYKDRNQLQIARSLRDLFDGTVPTEPSPLPDETFQSYKNHLLSVYTTPATTSSTTSPSPAVLTETLFQHMTSLYGCSDLQLRRALRTLSHQLRPLHCGVDA